MMQSTLRPFSFDDVLATVRDGTPCVLVTIVDVKGSAPREAGVRMLVTGSALIGTIGGGHLEWCAMEIAHRMLKAPAAGREIARIPLGPALGQCCGGVVKLAFEALSISDADWLHQIVAALADEQSIVRDVPAGPRQPVQCARRAVTAGVTLHADGGWEDRIAEYTMPVYLFGAGHVGHALVRVLAHLPCRVHWIDERDTLFPGDLPHNVATEATDTPEAEIDAAPPGSYFLVMTHSHALDLALCERIARRTDAAYFGLIGSKTKRARFEHRMAEHGIDPARIAAMVCPMGVGGIVDKSPDIIAVAIAAQLLQVRDSRAIVRSAIQPTIQPTTQPLTTETTSPS